MEEVNVKLRIRILRPPAGVQWALQKGASELAQVAISKGGEDLDFELEVRAQPGADGTTRLLGPFTQGPVKGRFVYLCAGTCAGQFGSKWTRRAKVPLTGVTWDLAKQSGLAAEFEGTSPRDGGPTCASIKLVGKGWTICGPSA